MPRLKPGPISEARTTAKATNKSKNRFLPFRLCSGCGMAKQKDRQRQEQKAGPSTRALRVAQDDTSYCGQDDIVKVGMTGSDM